MFLAKVGIDIGVSEPESKEPIALDNPASIEGFKKELNELIRLDPVLLSVPANCPADDPNAVVTLDTVPLTMLPIDAAPPANPEIPLGIIEVTCLAVLDRLLNTELADDAS